MKRIVILISGRGSNMRALFEAKLPGKIVAVISNNPTAAGLDYARQQDTETRVINHRDFADRSAFDTALANEVDSFAPDLVVLAGFMRILTEAFVLRFAGRILNIHPSLLPAFPGVNTHQRALDEGVRLHGCTVHFVTTALDHGPIIIQASFRLPLRCCRTMMRPRSRHESWNRNTTFFHWRCAGFSTTG
jgi:phosphoribosylglycinamide formyltransferase-1